MMKKFLSLTSPAAWRKVMARLKADQRGNVLIVVGFTIVPLTFTVGFGIDYARAMRLQTQLNAAADAAALAAVAPSMILQSDSEAALAATKMFNSQAALASGYQDLQMTPTITASTSGSSGALGYLRKATISYTVKSINMFGGILGADTLTVNGTASASAQQPPNVDFYLAMDNSPSMLLPATSDGITKILNATGCAFACHAQLPHTDGIYVNDTQSRKVLLSTSYYTSGSSKENVYYRWNSSTNTLYDSSGNSMNSTSTSVSGPTTTTTGNGNNRRTIQTTTTTVTTTTYSISDSTSGPVTITKRVSSTPTTTTTTTYINSGSSSTSTSTGSTSTTTSTYDTGWWADGYWLTHNYGEIYGSPSSLVLRKDDVVSAASQLIPFAANQASEYQVTYRAQMFSFDWTRSGSSTPVKTLNSLTDVSSYGSTSVAALFPADDYWWKNSMPTSSTNINDRASEVTNMLTTMKNLIPTAGTGAPGATPQKILFLITDGMLDQPNGSGRYFGPLRSSDLTECTAIKAKGIKIAVLYTQYLPESLVGDSWSQSNVAPFLPAPPSPYPAGNAGTSDQVLTALESCASPGTNGSPLVQTVTADDDITTALQQLFSTALQTSRLVQ
ncbi:TadE/TadG family type IV pilus assembly protein [Novosphingobium naphthalenivorans]|uniref:TadE/TadG family type IV pilus assembly protein n=1 Tax=Novosphingobium naphthalenivorans TaxID=273168 RepID=UPI000832D53C|nr:pilus assembly protein TadG-related protein [Novosphingobium naphthalenivorans]